MNLRVFLFNKTGAFGWLRSFCPSDLFDFRNHPKPTVLYVPQYVANFVSKKSCSI